MSDKVVDRFDPQCLIDFIRSRYGAWGWDYLSPHLLNATGRSEDGSQVDVASTVLMLSRDARKHVTNIDAKLIENAPRLLEACVLSLLLMEKTFPERTEENNYTTPAMGYFSIDSLFDVIQDTSPLLAFMLVKLLRPEQSVFSLRGRRTL